MKTKSLLDALAEGDFTAAFGGARRDEEKSRAKERVYSFRDSFGQWDPKNQRPELWNIFNSRINKGESIRVFPLSNWTEADVWFYIYLEKIPIVPLYFAKEHDVVIRGGSIVVVYDKWDLLPGEKTQRMVVSHEVARMRAVHGSDSLHGRHRAENYRGDDFVPPLGARKPRHRPRRGRLDGDQEARGLLLMSLAANQEAWGFESFMERNLEKDLLRFTTAGSVDDGKSTLIGRLLHDSKSVFEDQLAAIKKSRINRSTGAVDFSLLTDGLRAEREQGITIDVAYRYFETPRRKFIIADTPGHEQYTRNMATGASTANLAVILIDATKGVLAQTRRHTYIASLLGIPNVLVAINKMDLVDYARSFSASCKKILTPWRNSSPFRTSSRSRSARSREITWSSAARTCPGTTGQHFSNISKRCRSAWKRPQTRCVFPCNT